MKTQNFANTPTLSSKNISKSSDIVRLLGCLMGLHLRTVQDIHLQAPTKSAAKLILKRFIFMVLFLCLLLLAIIRFFSLIFVRFFSLS